jgi:hypothetical protein
MRSYQKHYEESVVIKSDQESVFAFADDYKNFSSHMNKGSWIMGGGKMETLTDEGKGKKMDSHIKMNGNILGMNLFLDEVIVQYEPPYKKAWETVKDINLIVIDHYKLGFEITPNEENSSKLKVYIDYNHPSSRKSLWLGYLFGKMYAQWCVKQMINTVIDHFEKE